jgi:hypothetical protein
MNLEYIEKYYDFMTDYVAKSEEAAERARNNGQEVYTENGKTYIVPKGKTRSRKLKPEIPDEKNINKSENTSTKTEAKNITQIKNRNSTLKNANDAAKRQGEFTPKSNTPSSDNTPPFKKSQKSDSGGKTILGVNKAIHNTKADAYRKQFKDVADKKRTDEEAERQRQVNKRAAAEAEASTKSVTGYASQMKNGVNTNTLTKQPVKKNNKGDGFLLRKKVPVNAQDELSYYYDLQLRISEYIN